LVSGIFSLYSDLIDINGEIANSRVFRIENGVAQGHLILPDSMEAGTYVLRAFTDLQREIGEEMFFHKTFKVSRVESSAKANNGENTVRGPIETVQKIDIAFLPEGGYLLAGLNNVVGIKAID